GVEPSAPPPPPSRHRETPIAPRASEAPRADDAKKEPRHSAPPAPSSLERLRKGLSRSRSSEGFFGRLRALFRGKTEVSPELAREIEEVLLTSDVGAETTKALLERVQQELANGEHTDPEKVWDAIALEAKRLLDFGAVGPIEVRHHPTVVLMVGVNGAGKTTTIGKLATKLQAAGHKCVLAAGDTFRAAAVQQLVVWGDRVGCEVVRGKEGSDPGSVLFEAIKRAQDTGADVVLADTAGRLHTKSNLMAEMKKIAKTAEKALPGAPHETFLVIDATNGQNALAQAREFREALPLSGIVLTKLDGTAKGGVVLGIAHTLKLPVRFIGLGERPDDLHEFRPAEFVDAMLGRESDNRA
ncbi:MAG TPA: signal recognition particle-docking protein FtsY, partial [Polyangiaceae bacterium]|nr:signal recognition particle-docking protein FtsY [Polyangiaceae bacterium]